MKIKTVSLIVTGVIALPLLLAGCGASAADMIPQELQGHWVDVNGSTMLDIDGKKMTVTSGSMTEKYKVRLSGEEVKSIVNARPENGYYEGFGVMGPITVRQDGSLVAYEQVTDITGHEYRFVREEQLEKELEIKVNDRDLPKSVSSDEITQFLLNFSTEDTYYDIPTDGTWESGRYVFEVERNDDGTYEMSLHASGPSYIIINYGETVPEDYVKQLAQLVKDQKLAEYNGWQRTNSEQFEGWSVYIEYASGEKIMMDASGRAALECPFSICSFLEYAGQRAGQE